VVEEVRSTRKPSVFIVASAAVVLHIAAFSSAAALAASAVSPPNGSLFHEGDTVTLQWELTSDERAQRLRATNGLDNMDVSPGPDETNYELAGVEPGYWSWTVETCRPTSFFVCTSIGTQKAEGQFSVFDLISLAQAKQLVRRTVEREIHNLDQRFRKLHCKLASSFKGQCKFVGIVSGFLVVVGKGRVSLSPNNIAENLNRYAYRFRIAKASALCVLKPTHNVGDCLVRERWKDNSASRS